MTKQINDSNKEIFADSVDFKMYIKVDDVKSFMKTLENNMKDYFSSMNAQLMITESDEITDKTFTAKNVVKDVSKGDAGYMMRASGNQDNSFEEMFNHSYSITVRTTVFHLSVIIPKSIFRHPSSLR